MERTRYNFWINEHQRDGLRAVKERDGITESEQIRRAIDEWLESRGVLDTRVGRKSTATSGRRQRKRT
jgi:hypothetical protein